MKLKVIFSLLIIFTMTLITTSWHYRLNPLETFALKFNDINFKLQKKIPNEKVLFIAVDEPSVNRYGRWPWKRKIVADGLLELKEADVVLMDMIFSEATIDEDDDYLAAALGNINSVCGFFLRHNSTQTITSQQEELLSDSALDLLKMEVEKFLQPQFIYTEHAEINIEKILNSCGMNATFSTFRDKDQLFRKYPTAYYYRDNLYPSLAVQALRIVKNEDIERLNDHTLQLAKENIIVDQNGFVRLNFYQKELYHVISFKDLYEKKYAKSYFKNKIVILGITDVGASDVRATPIGALSGPLVHYTFISNYLNNELIIENRFHTLITMMTVFVLALLIFYTLHTIQRRVVAYVVTYFIIYGVGRYLFIKFSLYIDLFYPLLVLFFIAFLLEIYAFITQEAEGAFIKETFSSYLSSELLSKLMQNPTAVKLGGEEKEMTILFSDIRSFTSFSEKMSPQELISVMNRYFTPMTESIIEHNGMLDKYIGDAVMAFYNAPLDLEKHADAACATALDMMQRLKELNLIFEKEGLPYINIGIGINSAKVVVGNMGSNQRFNYTVVGDGVNLASRVEGTNKEYKTNILITEFTKNKISDHFLTRRLEAVKVKGKDTPVLLYELMEESQKNRELKVKFELALVEYESKEYAKAMVMFEKLYQESGDSVSKLFYEKAKSSL